MVLVNEKSIEEVIKADIDLKNYFGEINYISIIDKSENEVYLIEGKKSKAIAKIGYRGWNKLEYQNHIKLYSNGYPVAKPIKYIPIEGNVLDGWGFGDLKREFGILFCEYIEGNDITYQYDENRVIEVINLLKSIHNDDRLIDKPIENYRKNEINRANYYLDDINSEIRFKLQSKIDSYKESPITLTFIHGGARANHFIYNSGGIYMLDLEAASMGDPYKDLIYFLIDLFILKLYSKRFIGAYFNRDITENDISRLNFFIIRQLLIKYKYGKTIDIREKALKYLEKSNPITLLGII